MHGAGVGPHLVGVADPIDAAATHHGNPVGERECLVVVVGDVQRSQPQTPHQHAQFSGEVLAQRPVQRPQWLVQHQQSGRGGQRPSQGHPLGLPTRQGVDPPALEAVQADQGQRPSHPMGPLVRRHAGNSEAEVHVAGHVPVAEQGVVLKHQPEPPLVGGHPRQVDTAPPNPAGRRLFQTGHGAQQGALAAT